MRNFQRKRERGEIDPYGDLEEGVHPDWTQVGYEHSWVVVLVMRRFCGEPIGNGGGGTPARPAFSPTSQADRVSGRRTQHNGPPQGGRSASPRALLLLTLVCLAPCCRWTV